MELIKTTIKVGNSAGVLLPVKYLDSQVKIILQPYNIEKDVLEILMENNLLKETIGIYLTGSYARKEENIESDIDILVITSSLNKRIRKNKYEIICISKIELEKQLKENALPILPMIKEAKVIMNKDLIKEYFDYPLTRKNLKWHIETTRSAMDVVKEDIKVSKEFYGGVMMNASAYSLILRLRTLYILECLKKGNSWNKKEMLNLIEKITGSLKTYNIYLDVKNKKHSKDDLNIKEAQKLRDYILKKIDSIEKWANEKKD